MLKHFFTAIMLICMLPMYVTANHGALRDDPFNTLPDSNTRTFRTEGRTYWEHEQSQRMGQFFKPFVYSGGLHEASVSSLTTAVFATVAYVPERVSQSAVAITYDSIAGGFCFTIISSDNNGITGWTRVTTGTPAVGTAYYFQCVASEVRPTLPDNSAWLMDVRLGAGGASITSVVDLRSLNPMLRGLHFGSLSIMAEGASGNGITDDTKAVQDTIAKSCTYPMVMGIRGSVGIPIIVEPGTYRITAKLTVPLNCAPPVYGFGPTSLFTWHGGNSTSAIQYLGMLLGPSHNITLRDFYILNGNASTGMVGLEIGQSDNLHGMQNVTIRKLLINGFDKGAKIWYESDELTFEENWIFEYTTSGIEFGGNSSVLSINKNHFQGGLVASCAVRMAASSSVSFSNNTIQSSSSVSGYCFTDTSSFTIQDNYFETGSPLAGQTDRQFVKCTNCDTGSIQDNTTAGGVLGPVITFDTNSSDITIGPNQHTCAGSVTSGFVSQAAGSVDSWHSNNIHILGPLKMSGCGATPVYIAGGGVAAVTFTGGRRWDQLSPFKVSYPLRSAGGYHINELWRYTGPLANGTPVAFLEITVDAAVRNAGAVIIEYAVVTIPTEALTKAATTSGRYIVAIATDGSLVVVGIPSNAEVTAVINSTVAPTVTFSTLVEGRLVTFRVQQSDTPGTNGAAMIWKASIILDSLVAPGAIGTP